jgi:PAS domain S-box-containing protein
MVEPIVESSTETVLNVTKAEAIRVLHVDDDQICLKVAKQCLETQGEFEVDTASSVDEALEKLKKTDYDVIVSDYQMPGKDGFEFLKELREKGNTVPFIVFTGKGREEIAMKALNLGASAYFTKQGQPETIYGELAHGIRQATERKETETTIWESEERLRAVFSSSPDAIAVSDLHGNILDCNEAAWKMLGFSSREELIGKSSIDFIAQKDRQRAYETLKKTLEQGKTRNLEYTLLNKDGEESWGELSASIMKDSSGNPSGFVSIMRDITERKKLEEEKSTLLHDLHQRVKELNCFYGMSRLFEKSDISLDDALQKTADLLPPAMQYPDITCTRIIVENREFSTKNFKETRWKLQADINVLGKKAGLVEVRYLEERPTVAEGPFLKEERLLIDAVAERLGKITERKKTEQASKESEEKSRSIVENSSDQIFMLDRDSRFLSVNKTGADLFRMSPQEMVGRLMPEVFPETIAAQFSKNIKNVFDTGRSMLIDEKMVVEGRELYSSASLNPVRDDSGRVIAVTGIVRDITERKKTEKMLQESEERFRAIFEGANDGILAADAKTRRFSFANPKICEITGYSLEELLKLGVGDINPKKDLPYVIDSFEEQRQGKVALSKDIPVLRKDGRVVYCDVSSKSLKIGGQEYLVGIFRDVTESKKAEEKLRQNSDRIEMMNEKLRVVGGLSRHDVNNKLSAVTGYAYLLKKKHADQADIVDGLGKMEQAVKEVGKIFDFARMYEKLGVEELTHVDVEKTLDEAATLFSGLTIKVVNGCHGLTVLADSFLRQLFYNLIDNTRKYGGKATAVRVYYEKAESGELRLVYEDDGVGISAENKLKLFTEGFSTGGSTGFGLFLIRKMMDIYSWQIQETGEPGKGAKFVITIPKANLNGKENYQLS